MEAELGTSELDFSTLRSAMPHPLGTRARVLLASVFGPYTQDDEYGSRLINPMELYQNQVTRVEFGWTSRVFASIGGPYVLWKIRQEEKRLAQGWTYEPPTFYDVNDAVKPEDCPSASRCYYVTPKFVSLPATEESLAQVREHPTGPKARDQRAQNVQ
jgi:hypothetical protein